MAQMRNAGTDVAKLTEWIGRKCRNHQPLSELKMKGQEPVGKHGQPGFASVKKDYSPNIRRSRADAGNTLLYTENGRTFKVTVEEVDDAEEVADLDHDLETKPVSY